MKNLSKKTIEEVGVDFVRYVNTNYEELLNSYYGADAENSDINFPTWCMVMYSENYSTWKLEVTI